MSSPQVLISVWSDYVCPFCYLEVPVLEQIKAEYGQRVEIRWRAFELRPDPVPTLDPRGEYLRSTWEEAVFPMAADRGMTLNLPPVQPRSRKAFEAACFARDHGRGSRMHQALFQAFFELGTDIGDIAELANIARAVELNASRLQVVLERGDYTKQVLEDRRVAERLGITSVPAILVQRADEALEAGHLLIGAQAYEDISEAVARRLDSVTA